MPEEQSKLEKTANEKPKSEEPHISPSVPWYEEHNQEAARKLGVKWGGNGYYDSDGCQVLDKYGQPLG
jgi:hypothetical protein